jgi:3-deoxy-7-phosphoheptulonate synthase
MIIVMTSKATLKDRNAIVKRLEGQGYMVDISEGKERTLIGAIGANVDNKDAIMNQLTTLPYVEKVVPILKPYKLAGKEIHERTEIDLGAGVTIGGNQIVIMAGPCAVEGADKVIEIAKALKAAGVKVFRAGAYKPRTSPYSFQGYGLAGLKMLAAVREETGMRIVTEVMAPRDLKHVEKYADVVQVGTRNMHNFELLKDCGKCSKPILLKRGLAATIEEWLLAAEYIMKAGNPNVILCERGIRTFEPYTRNTLDLNAVAAVKHLSHLPVVADPSHGTGRYELVAPMAKASIAAGADGLMLEAHTNPGEAISDSQQTISIKDYRALKKQLQAVAAAVGRKL